MTRGAMAVVGMLIFLCSFMAQRGSSRGIWAVEATRSEPIPLYMDEMLNAGRKIYDKQSPPVQDENQPTVVRLAMYIEGMSSFRTQTMDFQLDVYFQQFWKDPRLAHNETKRVLIRDKTLLGKMWHPDVYFANARIAEFHEVTQPNFLVWIEPDGSILYDTRVSMIVLCTLNLEKWPLDDQRCHLRILSYAYDTDQLQIEWKGDEPITRNPNIAMSDMRIVDLYPGLCDGNYSTGVWSCVTAEFFVKREITHHLMQSYVPTTLIVVISWFSFWLDVEAVPARVSLAITTLLTLSTQANAARLALPEVSYMKAIDVWMGACMMFVFGVMIEFTIVNYAQRQARNLFGIGRKWHRTDADIVMASSLESVMERTGKQKENNSSSNISTKARDLLDRIKGERGGIRQQLVEAEMEPDLSGQLRLRSMSRFSNYSSECGDDLNSPKHHCSDAPARQFGQKLSLLHPLWPFLDSRARNSVSLNSNNQSMTGEVDGHRPRSYSACHHIPTDNPCDSPRATANEIWKDREDQKAERLANWAAFDDSSGQICKRSPSVWSRLVPNGVAAHNGSANHSKSTTYGSMGEKKEGKRGDKWTNTIKQLQKHKKMAGRNRAKKIDQKSRWVFPATFIIFNILYWGYYCLY